jgi:hypothetical protein
LGFGDTNATDYERVGPYAGTAEPGLAVPPNLDCLITLPVQIPEQGFVAAVGKLKYREDRRNLPFIFRGTLDVQVEGDEHKTVNLLDWGKIHMEWLNESPHLLAVDPLIRDLSGLLEQGT